MMVKTTCSVELQELQAKQATCRWVWTQSNLHIQENLGLRTTADGPAFRGREYAAPKNTRPALVLVQNCSR
jgi:hypothetical protein